MLFITLINGWCKSCWVGVVASLLSSLCNTHNQEPSSLWLTVFGAQFPLKTLDLKTDWLAELIYIDHMTSICIFSWLLLTSSVCVWSFRLIATLHASLVSQLVCPHLLQSPFVVSCGLQLSQRKPSLSLSLSTHEKAWLDKLVYIFTEALPCLHLENERFYCSRTCSACQQSRLVSLFGTFL